MGVEQWVKDLTDKVVGPNTIKVGNYYEHPADGLIFIESGQYWGQHGLSNHWRWSVVATGEKKYGYGGSWPSADPPKEE